VLLNANVAFLAIDSVDGGGGTAPDQIASYMSAVMSVGSIIIGLLLVRQNRSKGREMAEDIVQRLCHIFRDNVTDFS